MIGTDMGPVTHLHFDGWARNAWQTVPKKGFDIN